MPAALQRAALALLVSGVCVASAAAAGVPDLDAVVRYRTRQLLPSGVTRVETWSERLVRRGDAVWTERLGAAQHPAQASGHRSFNVEASARLLTLDERGQVQLRYIDAAKRLVVAVPRAEWAAVGFDGRHDAAAHLVPPALIESMTLARAAAGGTDWRLQKNGDWSHRVHWSAARQVALRIESSSDDGRTSRTVTVLPQAATAAVALPWRAIDGYAQRAYDDFMD